MKIFNIIASFLILLISTTAIAANYGSPVPGSFNMKPRNLKEVRIIADRGVSDYYPENTAIAIQEAIKIKADMIMIDIRTTEDNIPIVIKDANIDRTTNARGAVKNKTAQELKSYNAGYYALFENRFIEESIPTLEDILKLLKNKKCIINIYDVNDIEPLKLSIKSAKYSESKTIVVLGSLIDIDTIKKNNKKMTLYLRDPLTEYMAATDQYKWLENAKKVGLSGFIISCKDFFEMNSTKRGSLIVLSAKNKLPIYLYGAGNTAELQKAMEFQVKGIVQKRTYTGKITGIITGDPAKALFISGRLKI